MKKTAIHALIGLGILGALSGAVQAQQKTEVTLARFFGACEADYGKSTDVKAARGECGVITTLVNQFNATNKDNIVVKPQIVEWGPYYDQLTARIVARDVPTIAVMHESSLGDFVNRKLIEPVDDGFKSVGIDTAEYSDHAKAGTQFGGKTYALPFDTWGWLWHFNLNLMKKAGLTKPDGTPVVPTTPEELLTQARKFKEATGKPYFSWTTVNSTSPNMRTFLTLFYQQNGAELFKGGAKPQLDMKSAQATKALTLMNQMYSEGLVMTGLDYGASNQAFVNGETGVVVVGTWKIDDFVAQSEKAGTALSNGYAVYPFPKLLDKNSVFADGHTWVMIKGGAKDEAQRKAALKFLKFLWDNDGEWARTGHLPANKTALNSAAFKALPMRSNIVELSSIGRGMPHSIPRQRAIEIAVDQEIGNMMASKKPLAETQEAAETRVNKLLDSVR
ncbi:MAG: extracellular solute-binding protein [Variovorax sp.]|nr:MAG: extracellular solute-binding protein [Variovorax sp.]